MTYSSGILNQWFVICMVIESLYGGNEFLGETMTLKVAPQYLVGYTIKRFIEIDI